MSTSKKNYYSPELQKATGKLPYNLINDYMFRIVFQQNLTALKGLLSSLLHIVPEEITNLEITNPIEIGKHMSEKEFRLDIKAILNQKQLVNLEMQVFNYNNWPERSIDYLCRMYDNVQKGADYKTVNPAVHISILDFTLFPNTPAFYSENLLMDKNTHHIYSDKFRLNVLCLKQIKLATSEDKHWKIDYWAKLFKATTWEEIKMIADNNKYLTEASNTLCSSVSDWVIQERCRDRDDYYARERYRDEQLAKQAAIIEQQNLELSKKEIEIQRLQTELERTKKSVSH